MIGFQIALNELNALRSLKAADAIAALRQRASIEARQAAVDCGRVRFTLQCSNLLHDLDLAAWLSYSHMSVVDGVCGGLHPLETRLFNVLGGMFPISEMNEEYLLNFEGDTCGILIESEYPFPEEDELLYECLRYPDGSFGQEMSLPVFLKLIDIWIPDKDVWYANAAYFGWPDFKALPLSYCVPDAFDAVHWRRLLKRRGWQCIDAVRRMVTHDTGNVFYNSTFYDDDPCEFAMTLDSVRMLEAQWAAAGLLRQEIDDAKYLVECNPAVISTLNEIFRKSITWEAGSRQRRTLVDIWGGDRNDAESEDE